MESLGPEDPEKVGPYRVRSRLGAGGMGQVYLAETPAGRRLAVKVIRAEHAADPRFRARFAREVEAARKVNDFYTASVVDADPEAASPWMATAYVPGPSLQALVAGQGALPPDRVRELGAGLAEGLAAIHACGLVHRDLKPGNIIVAEDGPRIIDFGIARALDASAMTATGAVIGTLAYMSPEQIEADEVGPPSDVFSLGGVLAFACTGRGPFDASSPGAIVHRVVSRDPDLDGVDPFLAGVITRCLTKNPAGRPTPAQLLAELRIVQSPVPPPPLAPPVVQRATPVHPPAAPPPQPGIQGPQPAMPPAAPVPAQGVMDARPGVAPTVPGAPVAPVTVPPLARSGAGQQQVRRRAVLAAVAGTLVAGGVGVLGWKELGGGGSAANAFKKATGLGEGDPTGGTWKLLEGVDVYELRSTKFSPDGKYMAVAGWSSGTGSQCAGIYDGTSGARLARLDGGKDGANEIAFSPHNRVVALACTDGKVRLYSVPDGRAVATLTGPAKRAMGVAWSTRDRIAAAGQDGGFLWDSSGRLVTRLARKDKYPGELYSTAFAPDGRMVATCGADQFVRLYDGVTGARIADLGTPSATSVAFSPDGRTLAVGEYGGTDGNMVRLWNVQTRTELAQLPGHKSVTAVAFSGDGRRLASGGDDGGSNYQGTIRVWDVASKTQLKLLTTPHHCMSVALNADGTKMLSSGAAKPVLWTGL
ncbi:WD40 repeat domain-containing serine/threonine protein kinase [Actinomadura oligospora]|uniref:WD40 repeat domain-containing serine/threonine protein kinase n=1 Tax=Actinomadura oligospora TaxID=111804 RepID=UPI00068451CD|nr:serine/threonine-protein kinase [Actinomadura oligospora]